MNYLVVVSNNEAKVSRDKVRLFIEKTQGAGEILKKDLRN